MLFLLAIRRREHGWYDEDHPLVFLFLGSSGIGMQMSTTLTPLVRWERCSIGVAKIHEVNKSFSLEHLSYEHWYSGFPQEFYFYLDFCHFRQADCAPPLVLRLVPVIFKFKIDVFEALCLFNCDFTCLDWDRTYFSRNGFLSYSVHFNFSSQILLNKF